MIVESTDEDYASLVRGRAPRSFKLPDTPIAPMAVLQMLADVAARVRESFSPASWLIIDDDEVVGLCSVTRPPIGGVVDIGYGIAPNRQNLGIASRAIGEIVAWAQDAPCVSAITAETSPANLPSQRVLSRNGFVKVGERHDAEDRLLICWRCPLD